MRKSRASEIVCNCSSYNFPHRMFGGSCGAIDVVEQFIGRQACENCLMNNGGCEVLSGQESAKECPYIQDMMHEAEIK